MLTIRIRNMVMLHHLRLPPSPRREIQQARISRLALIRKLLRRIPQLQQRFIRDRIPRVSRGSFANLDHARRCRDRARLLDRDHLLDALRLADEAHGAGLADSKGDFGLGEDGWAQAYHDAGAEGAAEDFVPVIRSVELAGFMAFLVYREYLTSPES